jgi:hypothetical protein
VERNGQLNVIERLITEANILLLQQQLYLTHGYPSIRANVWFLQGHNLANKQLLRELKTGGPRIVLTCASEASVDDADDDDDDDEDDFFAGRGYRANAIISDFSAKC